MLSCYGCKSFPLKQTAELLSLLKDDNSKLQSEVGYETRERF